MNVVHILECCSHSGPLHKVLLIIEIQSDSFSHMTIATRNAGIGSGSNPAFYTLKNEWLPVVTKLRRYIMNPPLVMFAPVSKPNLE